LNTPKETIYQNSKLKYQKAIKIVNDYLKYQNILVENDINNVEFQKAVLSLGGSLDSFKEEDRSSVLDFIKFIDTYENIDKNKRLVELKDKAKKQGLTIEEQSEVEALLPIDTPSTKEGDSDEILFSISTVFSNGYDNIAARDYAYKWTSNSEILRNNSQYGYYSLQNSCYSCWNDCTNFVSQALKAGGMKHKGLIGDYQNSNAWFYWDTKPSHTWGGAQNFYLHWKNRAGVASYVSSLQTGDAVNADFTGDGDMEHTAIITKNLGNNSDQKLLTQHSVDKEELTSLATWIYTNGYKIYGYEMDKASN
jgi:hypothetical protein